MGVASKEFSVFRKDYFFYFNACKTKFSNDFYNDGFVFFGSVHNRLAARVHIIRLGWRCIAWPVCFARGVLVCTGGERGYEPGDDKHTKDAQHNDADHFAHCCTGHRCTVGHACEELGHGSYKDGQHLEHQVVQRCGAYDEVHDVEHGVEGKEIHPFVMDRIKQVVGPETVAEYTGARNLASKAIQKVPVKVDSGVLSQAAPLAKPGTMATNAALKQHFNLNSMDVSSYPVLGNVQRSAESFVANGGKRTKNTGISGGLIDVAMKALDKVKVNEGYNKGLANRKVRDIANAAVVAGTFPVPGVGDHILSILLGTLLLDCPLS